LEGGSEEKIGEPKIEKRGRKGKSVAKERATKRGRKS